MNNKGFTLIEMLGVIVVLVSIMLIAVPKVSTTLNKNKEKVNRYKIQSIIESADLYASNVLKKNDITKYNNYLNSSCGINLKTLVESNYVVEGNIKGLVINGTKVNSSNVQSFYAYKDKIINSDPSSSCL